jgi:predicted nucleic acid-binding protein
MIDRESIYLDTSVPSAYFDTRWPGRMQMTRQFWDQVLPGYERMASELTFIEILNTKDAVRRAEIYTLVTDLSALPLSKEVERLADSIVLANLVPPKKREDALHLACAVVNGADYVVSWNFEHMVQVKTQKRLPVLCAQAGYFRHPLIVSPQSFLGGSTP